MMKLTRLSFPTSEKMRLLMPLIFLTLYGLLFGLHKLSGVALYGIPGTVLLFYLPGRLLMDLYAPLQKPWGVVGRVALAVFLSVTIIATMQIFITRYGLTEHITMFSVLFVNVVLYLLLILRNWTQRLNVIPPDVTPTYTVKTLRDLWPLLVMFGVLGIVMTLSPYPADADGFLTTLQKSVECQCVAIDFRQLFISYLALTHYVLGVPITILYRTLFPVLFFVSTGFTFDYALRHIKTRSLAHLAYLSILIAPAIVSEVNIIRPQVAMLVYTLPILVIAIEAWQAQSLLYTLIGLWFSLIAIGFHELSILLFAVALMPLVPTLWKIIITDKRLTWKQITLGVIMVLPYFKLLSLHQYFSKLISNVQLAIKIFPPIHWRWWFLDSYISIDGFNLGWPGIQAVYYYAYNGLLLLGFVAILCASAWVFAKRKTVSWAVTLPVIYAMVFLVVAELLPRLGFFFLPMRAWVHQMLALAVIVPFLFEIDYANNRVNRFLTVILPSVLISIGIIGTFYVAYNNVTEIFREEIPSITFMKHTEHNSLFISSQDNHTLVKFYGGRAYVNVVVNQKLDRARFDQIINRLIDDMKRSKVTHVPEIRQETKRFYDSRLISDDTVLLQEKNDIETKPTYVDGTPVYFLYSVRKASGVNSRRLYNRILLDQVNKDTYAALDYPISYRDDAVVILKLR